MTRLTALLASMLLIALACSPSITAAQDIDPGQFVLSLADLPPGFAVKAGSDRYVSNADAANGNGQTLSELDGYGRQLGYTTAFVRASANAENDVALLEVESQTSVYETTEGAHGLFELRTQSTPEGWSALSTPPLADEATGIGREVENAGGSYELRAILLRKGRIVASITTLSLPGSGLNETVELAQAVAGRLP